MKPLRRTITTLSHFITSTRSWQGKPSGLWLCLSVFILFSCKDEAANIGFKKDPRLFAHFVDIPLNPSVILDNKTQTTNMSGETLSRILIGRYNDPLFGKTEAIGYVNLAPPISFLSIPSDATYDSLVLQLKFDYYYYGDVNASTQRLQLFQLLDTLSGTRPYNASSSIATGSSPIAETSFVLSPANFDNALVVNADDDTTNNQTFTLPLKIPGPLGPSLFNDLQHDSTLLVNFDQFSGKYKGFALKVPDGFGDKIFGINPLFRELSPAATDTKLTVYYTQNGVSLSYDFLLAPSTNYVTGLPFSVASFSQLTTDRSATALNGIVPYKEYRPGDNRFYIQGGTSLLTKLDLTNFYNYVDTLDNIIFNSAELVVNNVLPVKSSSLLSLRVLDSLNHFRYSYIDTLAIDTLRISSDPYFTKSVSAFSVNGVQANQTVNVRTDAASDIFIAPDTHVIDRIGLTEFCQVIYKYRHDKRRVKSIGLTVQTVEAKKSVHGVILDSNIALRVYYSKPTVKIR